MTVANLTGRLRRRIGNPTLNEASDREMLERLSTSLSWLSAYLKWTYVTDLDMPLTAGQPAYALPRGCLYLSFVQLGPNILTPTSTWAINSGAVTTATSGPSGSWLTALPGLPNRYAVEGRELLLNPPPDAGTVLTYPAMTWRYVAVGTEWTQQSEIGFGAQGMPSLSEVDEDLLMYDAAIGWCVDHPSPDNQQRLQGFQAEIQRRLPEAKRRWENAISDYLPTARPDTSGRLQAAR